MPSNIVGRLPLLATALLLATLGGCGNKLEAEVSGVVTLNGQPIGPGTVNFAPMSGGSNPAVGTIMPDGSYSLKTSRTVGLAAGTYRVAVSVFENQASTAPGQRSNAPPKLRTPEKYNSVETSGLQFEVEPGDNTIDIELTS
jgi:hypothetical protein